MARESTEGYVITWKDAISKITTHSELLDLDEAIEAIIHLPVDITRVTHVQTITYTTEVTQTVFDVVANHREILRENGVQPT